MTPATVIERSRAAGKLWAGTTPRDRRKVLARLACMLAERRDEFVSAIVCDTGKPPLDALGGDVLVTLEHMRFYHRHAHTILSRRRLPGDLFMFGFARFTRFYEPHGVVLIYGPANYPLQLGMVPAITALHAGNAVVLKISEETPSLTAILRDLVADACLPADLMQIVCDPPKTAADYIDAHPDFICFTGSSTTGAFIAERAARHLIPTLLELGGKDAALVFEDCHLDRTVEGVLYGAFSNAGRVCVGIKRLFIEQPLYAEFTRRLIARTLQLRVGSDGTAPFDVPAIQSERLLNRLATQVADAVHRGATVLTDPANLSGASPLVLANVPADALILREEAFGPVVCVAPFHDEAHAIQVANDGGFALGASLWTRDIAKAHRIAAALNAPNIAINDVIRNIANPAAPFGGNQRSGYGRYHGAEGLLAFSRTKTIMTQRSAATRERHWFPLTPGTYNQLRGFIHLRHRWLAGLFARLFFGLVIVFPLLAAQAQAKESLGHLRLRVEIPVTENKGELAYLVFSGPSGFPKNSAKAILHGFLPLEAARHDIDLGELPPGHYAVSLYLDVNGNHKLDTGWLGIPTEPVGVSRNPRPRMGPPRFEDSVFEMTGADTTLAIHLVKP